MKVTDEELKAIFRRGDYTTYAPKYDASKRAVAENNIHSRAKTLFYKAWCGQLVGMGGKMMVSQSVPGIMQITKKHGAHEDFVFLL